MGNKKGYFFIMRNRRSTLTLLTIFIFIVLKTDKNTLISPKNPYFMDILNNTKYFNTHNEVL